MRLRSFLVFSLLLISIAITAQVQTESQKKIRITKGPVVEHAGPNSAVIAWSTNVSSGTVLKYGTSPNLDEQREQPWGGYTHRVTIKNLQPGTRYYFQAISNNAEDSGASVESVVDSFQTPKPGEVEGNVSVLSGPIIQNVNINGAQVQWKTNMRSSTVLKFGTSPDRLTQTREAPWGQQKHSVELKNLQPSTRYYVEIQTSSGRVMTTASFRTPAANAKK